MSTGRKPPHSTSTAQSASDATKQPIPLFDFIYETAKQGEKGDYKPLTHRVNAGASIEVHRGIHTPVSLLAAEGDRDAVDFLLDRFGANINRAVFGYATRNAVDDVNALLHLGAHVDFAVKGYAQGDFPATDDLITHHQASLAEAASGYATGGHHLKVEHLLEKNESLLTRVVEGYALGGKKYQDSVKRLIQQDPVNLMRVAAHAYATIDLVDAAEALSLEFGIIVDNEIVLGAAIGGHTDQVNKYIKKNPLLKQYALQGYAAGGHDSPDIMALDPTDQQFDTILWRYSVTGNMRQVETILEQKKAKIDNKEQTALLEYIAEPILQSGLFANSTIALRSLSFIRTLNFRESLSSQLHKTHLVTDEIKTLALTANQISESMSKHAINYHVALAATIDEPAIKFLLKIPSGTYGLLPELLAIIVGYLTPLNAREVTILKRNNSLFNPTKLSTAANKKPSIKKAVPKKLTSKIGNNRKK